MTDQEKIVSNDYYDIIADYTLPRKFWGTLRDFIYQPVSGEIGVVYANRREIPQLSVSEYTYQAIPKLYGLMQQRESFDPTPLIRSGITEMQNSALNLTGRGVIIGFLDTGERVIILPG